MPKKYTLKETEEILEKVFKGKLSCFSYPGYKPVYGICNRIFIMVEKLPEKEVGIELNGHDAIYSVSLEQLKDCLTVIKKIPDGDTQ